jgi:SWI/SNF-related matrix-associated actin-dependent regulator 1 of chromatin subfamily A
VSTCTLYSHQREAVDFLRSRRAACLADDQGLGKTISVAVAAKELGLRHINIVAPSNSLWNWQRELKKWMGVDSYVVASGRDAAVPRNPDVRVRITSHSLILNDDVRELLCKPSDLLVVDESQFFIRRDTGNESIRARLLYRNVAKRARRVWLLTGTPAPNGFASELWSMLHGLMPDDFPETFGVFRARYCQLKRTVYGDGLKPFANKNMIELHQRMQGFMLRRMKKNVLSLPPRRIETYSVKPTKMPPGLAELSTKLRRRAARASKAVGDEKERAAKIAAHDEVASAATPEEAFRAMLSHEDLSRFRRLCGAAKAEPAIELVESEFRTGAIDCIVLFAYHTEVVDALKAGLAEHKPVVIDGRTSARDRQRAVDSFQSGEANVFIGQIQAAGTAITLTRACEALFVELSFKPGDNMQAGDRIYRIGQTRPCRSRFLSLAHSVDELLVEIVRNKVLAMRELLA